MPRSPDPIVEAREVSKRFGARVAVAALDLRVAPGICFGLLGPNGAGKTTALRMIYGVARPSSGSVRVFGIDVARNPRAVRARLGVTLQENVQIEALSAEDNLRIFSRYHLLREPTITRRVDRLLDDFELRSHLGVPVRALSGGFRRRLSIAMSLLNEPELLILDEPTTGLDPAVRLALWSRVRELRARGTAVLLTTHYMDEAERLCDRVAIMNEGRSVCEDPPAVLVETHVAPEAIELDCTPAEEARIFDGAGWQRLRSGDRIIVFTDTVRAVVERIHSHDRGDRRPLIVRSANLEDVFLATTGTQLEDQPESLSPARPRRVAAQRDDVRAHLAGESAAQLLRAGLLSGGARHRRRRLHLGDGRNALRRVPGARTRVRVGNERRELRGHLQHLRAPQPREDLRRDAHHADRAR